MAKTKDRFMDATGSAKPYVERALKDEQVRDDVKSALSAARDVYNELMGGRGVTQAAARVATDKEIQESLKNAIEDLRHAADRIQGKDQHKARNTFLLLIGVALGAMFNPVTGPATRKWVRESLFGSDEDFSYSTSGTNSSGMSSYSTAGSTPGTSSATDMGGTGGSGASGTSESTGTGTTES